MQLNDVPIETTVKQFIAENFMYRDHFTGMGDRDSLLEAGLIDSTGILELVMFLEKTFAMKVADDEVVPENLDSVELIAAYVRRKSAAMEVTNAPRALSA